MGCLADGGGFEDGDCRLEAFVKVRQRGRPTADPSFAASKWTQRTMRRRAAWGGSTSTGWNTGVGGGEGRNQGRMPGTV